MTTRTALSIGMLSIPAAVRVRPAQPRVPFFDAQGLADKALAQSAVTIPGALGQLGVAPPSGIALHVDPHRAASRYDGLEMPALAELLTAAGAAPPASPDAVLLGDLTSMRGALRFTASDSTLPALYAAEERRESCVVVAEDAAWMADLVPSLDVRTCGGPRELLDALVHPSGLLSLPRAQRALWRPPAPERTQTDMALFPALARPFALAAAGGLNLALVTQPSIDRRAMHALAGILPPLSPRGVREVLTAQALASDLRKGPPPSIEPPFQSPHESVQGENLAGAPGRPGVLTLANLGLLALGDVSMMFIDALNVILDAVADGTDSTVRTDWRIDWPARFLLAGIVPPCGCASSRTWCTCNADGMAGYVKRMAPRVERGFAMAAHVADLRPAAAPTGPTTAALREVVARARAVAIARQGVPNGAVRAADASRLGRGTGAPLPILRIARTIADVEGRDVVTREDLDEARSYDVGRAFDAR